MRSTGLLFIDVVEVYKADKGLTALVIGLLGFGFAVFCKNLEIVYRFPENITNHAVIRQFSLGNVKGCR